MALNFHPRPGAIFICNFDTGFRAPEMVKARLCVVISPRLRRREGLCTVVPLSTTAPREPQDYHRQIAFPVELPPPWQGASRWAKCDMLATVAYDRLTPVGAGRAAGKRRYVYPSVSAEELTEVRAGVLAALGLQKLTGHL